MLVASDSDEDIDDDTVFVGGPPSSSRTVPNDVGFTDFDDFGGFQASDSPQTESLPTASTPAKWQSELAASTDRQWNAFLDPTDAGETGPRLGNSLAYCL